MNDISPETDKINSTGKRLLRRGFLRNTMVTALAALAEAGCSPQPEQPKKPVPTETLESLQKKMTALIQKGKDMRTQSDIDMLDNTYPGIDLTYSNNPTIARIRKIADPIERIMAAIGFLDVNNSKRYNHPDRWTCNTYALDLLRLLLGNEVIGSRYEADGKLSVAGKNDLRLEQKTQRQIDEYNSKHPFVTANDFDEWMEQKGSNFGWSRVGSDANLQILMNSKNFIVVGVTRNELIKSKKRETGHMFVLVPIADGFIGLTQSTNNILLSINPFDSPEPKIHTGGDFNLYSHALVSPSP